MKHTLSVIALFAAMPAAAQDTRQLDAHEHGVGILNIAVDGTMVDMTFEAPGADIVGFEYAATSDVDRGKIADAIARLSAPLNLFVLPDAAGCSVVTAETDLEGGDAPVDHDEEHHEDEGDHDHEDHAEEAHDDDHDEHDHDEHANADHADDAGHTEFHAEFELICETPDALTEITFAYFDAFPNAQEVEVQMITASGAQAYEVTRDAPVLDLER